MTITEKVSAYAKINLVLLVGEKVPPLGFHRLESIFVRLGLSDSITITTNICRNSGNEIFINCRFDQRLTSHINSLDQNPLELRALIESRDGIIFKTCMKVLETLGRESLNISIDLVKSIPLEAGLGGGSADAAAVLGFFSRRFNLSKEAKLKIAQEVGFDVGPCLFERPSYSSYDGQHHTSPLGYPEGASRRYALILKPPLGSNTTLAYQALGRGEVNQKGQSRRLNPEQDAKALLNKIFINTKKPNCSGLVLIENDFQDTVFREIPELERLLIDLNQYNPILSGLSGSGSSIFSLFRDYKTALKAYQASGNLSEKGWFIAISQILSL